MKINPDCSWQYNEFQQVGTDYGSKTEVKKYDSSHADFRDVEAENAAVLDLLQIGEQDTVIDIGSGTGVFAIQAAKRCAKVYAIDVSKAMIDFAAEKADKAGTNNIEFHHAGFLTYEHNDSPVDAVVTTFTFHHLPDFWKGIALKRINTLLKAGGLFYIHDVILQVSGALDNITGLINRLASVGGEPMRVDAERHFRDEFSTYDWVMDGLLERSGFDIVSKEIQEGVIGRYLCQKNIITEQRKVA